MMASIKQTLLDSKSRVISNSNEKIGVKTASRQYCIPLRQLVVHNGTRPLLLYV